MKKWNSSPHPISDIKDWNELGRLEINPEFQRGYVWSEAAKVMLIDSILNEIPLPKILVSKKIISGSTHRIIIDGQQRTKTILEFINNEFKLKKPYDGSKLGQYFKDFEPPEQENFLSYTIDFNESQGLSDSELRDVYSRLNKYTFQLNKQELRRADFPGDFLTTCQDLAHLDALDDFRIFSSQNRRRLADEEYVSELVSAMIDGPQDKKNKLDHYYLELSTWPNNDIYIDRFKKVLNVVQILFDETYPISKTRFKQKSDFYSLFIAIDKYLTSGYEVNEQEVETVRKDLELLNRGVAPSSDVNFFNLYAERCLASANTIASRNWRVSFISLIIKSLFDDSPLKDNQTMILISIRAELHLADLGFNRPKCEVCDKDIKGNLYLAWNINEQPTITNLFWVHHGCVTDKINYFANESHYDTPDNLKELSQLV